LLVAAAVRTFYAGGIGSVEAVEDVRRAGLGGGPRACNRREIRRWGMA